MSEHLIEVRLRCSAEEAEDIYDLLSQHLGIRYAHLNPTVDMTSVITQAPDPVARVWQDDLG